MASRYSNGGRGGSNNLRNACLTMHQPWASLLVYGIKRIEGRSWPSPITGRLWIHAAGKIPEPETIKAMEDFYREIYAVDGVTDLKFPEHYPVSRLLGCVEIVGCLKCEELTSWKEVPEGVRLEGLTEYCWLCEKPQKLIIPFEMRGFQGVYNLENKIYEAAVRGLRPVDPPLPVKFPLPNPQDLFSLRPGSVSSRTAYSSPTTPNTPELSNAVAGARAAATQFKKSSVQAGTRNNRAMAPVYNVENRVYNAAVRGLQPVDPPLPVKFPLPNPQDSLSVRPGSVSSRTADSSPTNTPDLSNAIAGARAAATQFKKNSVQSGTRDNKAIAPAQGVCNLENRIYKAAIRGLRPFDPPVPIKSSLPDPQRLVSSRTADSSPTTPNTPELINTISGARAATAQFKKNNVQAGTRNNKAIAPAQEQNRQIPGWFDDGGSSSTPHRR